MISVLDYGAGNLRSVGNTLTALGVPFETVRDAASLARATKIILPGVGHFGQMMRALDEMGVRSTLVGRLLHDAKAVLADQLSAVELASERRGYAGADLALLVDGLRADDEVLPIESATPDVIQRGDHVPRRPGWAKWRIKKENFLFLKHSRSYRCCP